MSDRTPQPPAAAVPTSTTVESISYDFNRISTATGTADHGFLTFHLSDHTVRTLGGHPLGPDGKLQFCAEFEVPNARQTTGSFPVSVPPGMNADSYARSLVHAAENYNTHPLPYSAIGEEGYNSTSSTSSLLYHVGGPTALQDLQRIAKDIGVSSHVETHDGSRPRADLRGMGAIDLQTIRGREIATGLDHASIPPDYFSRGPVAPFHDRGMGGQERFEEAVEGQLLRVPTSAQQQLNEVVVSVDRALHYRPSTLQYERDNDIVETSSLQQHGRLLEVNETTIVQDTGRGGRATYSRAELERAAGDNVDSLRSQLVPGNDVCFSFSQGNLTTTTLHDRSWQDVGMPTPGVTR